MAHLSGTVVLSMVVDTEGSVENLAVVKPLGLGLDDQAAQTVSGWKFKPAMRDGTGPVSVRMLVEVTFRLFGRKDSSIK